MQKYQNSISNTSTGLPVKGATVRVQSWPGAADVTIYGANNLNNLAGVVITGTAGQFSCNASTLAVGDLLTISGTLGGTGTIVGYATPTTYQISATNGTTTFTLIALSGAAIATTAGTPTGLTYSFALPTNILTTLVDGSFAFHAPNAKYQFVVTPPGGAPTTITDVQLFDVADNPGVVNWTIPGTIGSGTPNTGAFTTLSVTGQVTSTLATGTAPFVVASTTAVANLNASLLLGGTWAAPAAIGTGTANSVAATTISATGAISQNFAGQTRSLTPVSGALVREWADSVAATTGNIEIGMSYNCAVNPTTGVWAGRDITDVCWLEKWSDVGSSKQFWFAPSAVAGTVPVWQQTFSIDGTSGIVSSAPMDSFANFTASVAANALTGTVTAPLRLNFRSATLTTGTPVAVSVATQSLVVPSGATLGTVNGVAARLVWLLAYNAGTPVLCVVNMSGGVNLDETTLISPTTISAGSTSASVIYSAAAVAANSPFRVIGFTDITEAAAGTWATAPTTVQPSGGNALTALGSLGYGQTPLANGAGITRAYAVTYYNTTGRPIVVQISNSTAAYGTMTINGVAWTVYVSGTFVVPIGGSYIYTTTGGVLNSWTELR